MLQMLATSSGARRIVEVQAVDGDETGESTLALCEALKKTGGTLVSIVRDSEQADALRAQVREAGYTEHELTRALRQGKGEPQVGC